MLALDVDGTLLNSRHELSDVTRAAVRAAQAAGIRVALVTGKRYRKTLPFVEPLGLDVPLVSANGTLIKHPSQDHKTLFLSAFPRPVLLAWLREVERFGQEPIVYADTYHEGFDFYHRGRTAGLPELADYLERNPHDGRVRPDLMEDPPDGIFAGFATGTRESMLKLAARLETAVPNALYVHVLRSPLYAGYLCEIAPIAINKWSGVRFLADQWEIKDDEICAVGDDINDLPMIEAAGLGVAMGNAVAEVKAAADRIAPTHDEHGVAQVVQWLLDERQSSR